MPTEYELRLEGVYKVIEWMQVRNREGLADHDADGLKCDLQHSSLIHWLCLGKEPLPERPPVRFSRPDHQAAVDGRFTLMIAPRLIHNGYLNVDQEAWKVLETRGANEWVAAYPIAASGWSAPWSVRRENNRWVAERLP